MPPSSKHPLDTANFWEETFLWCRLLKLPARWSNERILKTSLSDWLLNRSQSTHEALNWTTQTLRLKNHFYFLFVYNNNSLSLLLLCMKWTFCIIIVVAILYFCVHIYIKHWIMIGHLGWFFKTTSQTPRLTFWLFVVFIIELWV